MEDNSPWNFAKLVMTKTHANLGGLVIMVFMGVSHESLCIDGDWGLPPKSYVMGGAETAFCVQISGMKAQDVTTPWHVAHG